MAVASMQSAATKETLGKSLLERARALVPVLREREAACNAQARVPDGTIQAFEEAGVFCILEPERWGGYELPPILAGYSYLGSIPVASGPEAFLADQPFEVAQFNAGVQVARLQLMFLTNYPLNWRLNFANLRSTGLNRRILLLSVRRSACPGVPLAGRGSLVFSFEPHSDANR